MSDTANGPDSVVSIGPMDVSRLIVGHNPPAGNSHVDDRLNAEMREYFTVANTVAMYRHAESLGLKTFMIRSDYQMLEFVEQYRRSGGTMSFIAQTASEMHDIFANIRVTAAAGAGGIYHHGTQTDKFWREGRIDDAKDYLRCMRDCGVAVGLASHQPEIIEYVEEHGWDVDFYMCSFYNLSRVPRESAAVTGRTAYDEEIYVDEDRDAMCRVIRAVSKPVLAFKILAASRHCETPGTVAAAYQYAYANIKPTDAVVVGFFPRDHDEVAEGVAHAAAALTAPAAGD